MKIFEQTLLKKLPQYAAEGLIDPASRARLEARLRAELSASSALWWWVLYMLGGILVSLGVILLVRNHWCDFSPDMRLFLGAAPLLASAFIGLWVLARRPDGLWAVFTPLLNIAGIMCAIGVIAQVYQLPNDGHAFFWAVLWLSSPLPFLFRSQLAPAACIFLLSCWAGGADTAGEIWAPVFFCAYAAPMVWVILRPCGRGGAPFQWLAIAIGALSIMPGISSVWECFNFKDEMFYLEVPALACYVSVILLWCARCRRRGNNGWGVEATLAVIGLLAFTVAALIWGSSSFVHAHMRPFWLAGTNAWAWSGLVLLAAFALGIACWLYRAARCEKEASPYLIAAISGLFAPAWLFLGAFPGVLDYVFEYGGNLLLVAVVALFLREGIRHRLYGPLNTGIGMLLLSAWVRFAESEYPLLARAIAFLCLGAFLIGMNAWLNRARGKEARS